MAIFKSHFRADDVLLEHWLKPNREHSDKPGPNTLAKKIPGYRDWLRPLVMRWWCVLSLLVNTAALTHYLPYKLLWSCSNNIPSVGAWKLKSFFL